jgi:hypothetical protein
MSGIKVLGEEAHPMFQAAHGIHSLMMIGNPLPAAYTAVQYISRAQARANAAREQAMANTPRRLTAAFLEAAIPKANTTKPAEGHHRITARPKASTAKPAERRSQDNSETKSKHNKTSSRRSRDTPQL